MPPNYDQADLTKMAGLDKQAGQILDEILNGDRAALKASPVKLISLDRSKANTINAYNEL